jgi:hypothetical protein
VTSREKILYGIDIARSKGLEIGPLANPLVPKEAGEVYYVDRAPTEEIIRWYRIDGTVAVDQIVEIDFVWGDRSLSQCVGGLRFDYCVAAHVVEHVPDLITWFQEIGDILVDGGIAAFSIPDKRYTFDILRPLTVPADLLDAYARKLRRPSIRHIYDHFSSFTEVDVEQAWRPDFDPGKLKPAWDARFAYAHSMHAINNDRYVDSHCWVFSADSFIGLLATLSELGLIDFMIHRFFEVPELHFEFVVQLEKISPQLPSEEKHRRFLANLVHARPHELRIVADCLKAGKAQVYWDTGKGFDEQASVRNVVYGVGERQTLVFRLPPVDILALRFDPNIGSARMRIHSLALARHGGEEMALALEHLKPMGEIKHFARRVDACSFETDDDATDPRLLIDMPAACRRHLSMRQAVG